MTSQGHSGSLLLALWCCDSGCTQWNHSEGRTAAIKPRKGAYSAVQLAIWVWNSQRASSLSLQEPSDGSHLRFYLVDSSNCEGKMFIEKQEIDNQVIKIFDMLTVNCMSCWYCWKTFISIFFPQHKNITVCIQKSFAEMYYSCYSLEVRFEIIFNKRQLLPYIK